MRGKRERITIIRILMTAAIALFVCLLMRVNVSAQEAESIFAEGSCTFKITEINSTTGTFTMQITVDSSYPMKEVSAWVWCAEDKSDNRVYTAKQESDNTYTMTVSATRHQNHLGIYKIEAYGKTDGGAKLFLGKATQYFNPQNFLTVQKTDVEGERLLKLENVSDTVETVSFAVWSKDGGQDDLIWTGGHKNEDGTWSATIEMRNYRHEGKFNIHTYVDGSFSAERTFKVKLSEMGKNGWYYEDGLKLYYSFDQLQTDVRDLVGGPYQIRVNRTCCTITIYSAEGEDDYIIPVVSFCCSVGLPDTPTPTGTFYTGTKYRWKTLMGPTYGQYVTHVVYAVYFHSVAGYNMTSYNLDPGDYNNLGNPASHGCIRLCVRDAKWMYENLPSGTPVYIYDSEWPGPFGKPELPKIPAGQNWDPTDPEV